MTRALVAALLLAVACSGGEPTYTKDDLPRLVLTREDAPVGTELVDASSGERTLASYAESEEEKRAYQAVGFQLAYFQQFLSPGLLRKGPDGEPNRTGSLAISFVLLFETASGAGDGLNVLETQIRKEGRGLSSRPTPGLPEESFGLSGELEKDFPPGFMFAWRDGNTVRGLIAAGVEGAIREDAALSLAERMARRR